MSTKSFLILIFWSNSTTCDEWYDQTWSFVANFFHLSLIFRVIIKLARPIDLWILTTLHLLSRLFPFGYSSFWPPFFGFFESICENVIQKALSVCYVALHSLHHSPLLLQLLREFLSPCIVHVKLFDCAMLELIKLVKGVPFVNLYIQR